MWGADLCDIIRQPLEQGRTKSLGPQFHKGNFLLCLPVKELFFSEAAFL